MSGAGQHQHHHLTSVEQHLGDRLAAFVDGELHDDARDRVLAHLATCPGCKDAADEQRRLKNVVAGAAPPTLSAGFLARLQGLPGGDDDQSPFPDDHGGGDIMGTASLGGERLDGGLFGGSGRPRSEQFSLPFSFSSRGFRIHEMAPHRTSSPASSVSCAPASSSSAAVSPSSGRRGRRLAFAAAGAFSMAAIALGGALPLDWAVDSAGEDPGPAASPLTVNTNVNADSTADLADLWSASDGVGLAVGDEAPGQGVLRPPTTTLPQLSAARALSIPGMDAGAGAGTDTGTGSGANAPQTSDDSSPSPPLASRAGHPLAARSAPSPSTMRAPVAPAVPAPDKHLLPMGSDGAAATP